MDLNKRHIIILGFLKNFSGQKNFLRSLMKPSAKATYLLRDKNASKLLWKYKVGISGGLYINSRWIIKIFQRQKWSHT